MTSFLLLLSGKLVKRRPLKNETFARQLVCILFVNSLYETFARRLVYILFSRPLKVLLISDIQQISLRKPLINLQVFLSL